jgi:hypothetical protein
LREDFASNSDFFAFLVSLFVRASSRPVEMSPHKCPDCPAEFPSRHKLRHHGNKEHKTRHNVIVGGSQVTIFKSEVTGRWGCPAVGCSKEYSHIYKLKAHLQKCPHALGMLHLFTW